MAQLTVRNLDGDLLRALKRRAARHGCSAEAEHRDSLLEALAGDIERPAFKDFLATMPDVGIDADYAPHRGLPREVSR